MKCNSKDSKRILRKIEVNKFLSGNFVITSNLQFLHKSLKKFKNETDRMLFFSWSLVEIGQVLDKLSLGPAFGLGWLRGRDRAERDRKPELRKAY